VTSPPLVTAGAPQASVATTEPGVGAGTAALQPSGRSAGQVITGGIISTTFMIAWAVVVQPLKSVTVTV